MDFLAKYHIIHSYLGLFHTLVALVALICGSIVFLKPKGTLFHKRIGYVYVVAMISLNVSALFIYNFGKINLFHGFALLSLGSIIAGMYPALKRKNKDWMVGHFYGMSWSVVGLYAAFWAETGVRFFDMRYFWWVVMLATFLTCLIGGIIINKKAKELVGER